MTVSSRLSVLSVTVALLCGCKSVDRPMAASSLEDFAFDPTARNFAILAGNDGSAIGNPLGGVPTDIQTWWDFLCKGRPYQDIAVPDGRSGVAPTKCTGGILGNYEIVYANKTGTTAQDLTAAMSYVGQNLEDTSTLVLIYSGHGSESGNLIVTPESPWAPFGEALEAAAKLRNKRAARFYFFNDSCFSGKVVTDEEQAVTTEGTTSASLVEGQILPLIPDGFFGRDLDSITLASSIGTSTYQPTLNDDQTALSLAGAPVGSPTQLQRRTTARNQSATDSLARQIAPLSEETKTENPAFAQAIIFSAANEAELAGDEGANRGGTFTSRLKETIEHFQKQYRPTDQTTNPSLQRVFNAVARYVQDTGKAKGRIQVPQYRVTPECVLQEKFFMTGQPALCAAPK